MMKRTNFFSRQQASRIGPSDNTVIISISDPYQSLPALIPGWRDVLTLQFHDILGPLRNHMEPAKEHAEAIVEFARKHADMENIWVHCEAGISRSAATALALDAMGWSLENKARACYANTRLVYLLCCALGEVIKIPQQPADGGSVLLWDGV